MKPETKNTLALVACRWSLAVLLTWLGGIALQAQQLVSNLGNYFPGETIRFEFSGGPGNTKDWIGIYPDGVTPGSVGSTLWSYVDGTRSGNVGLRSGEVAFGTGLDQPGTWNAFFLLNDGYDVLTNLSFTVLDPAAPAVRPSRRTFAPGQAITVGFTNGPANPKDWIGVYRADQPPGSVGSTLWYYVDGTANGTAGLASGSVTFSKGLAQDGDYVVYLLENDGYTILAREAITVATPVFQGPSVLTSTPANGSTNAFPDAAFAASITNGTGTAVAPATVRLTLDGFQVAASVVADGGLVSVAFTNATLLPPGSAHTYVLSFSDSSVPPVEQRITNAFSIRSYRNIELPAPLLFENFDGVTEGSIPNGWTLESHAPAENTDVDFGNLDSAAFANWTVVEASRFNGRFITYSNPETSDGEALDYLRVNRPNPANVVNGRVLREPLASGRFLFCTSGYRRGGSQVFYAFTPDFNLTGRTNVHVGFKSLYEQNQDSIGALEYSIDGGVTWMPVAYYLDGPDIVRTEAGAVDAVATFTTERGDVAAYVDENGNTVGGTYGAFIAAPISEALAPFIEARVNDDPVESKRQELYRLPMADNQARVRLRFAYAGTDSWYWGVDDFGMYALSSTNPPALFSGFINKGLVGVGRLSANTFDKAGDGRQDTLGGFSAMMVDTNSLVYANGRISGRLIGLPDRGFGDGATDFRPRLEMFDFSIAPYYGSAPVGQDQVTFTNVATTLFTYGAEGFAFTGFDASNTNAPVFPQSPSGSIGGGRRSLDPEGIAFVSGGGYWVSDEYGPGVYRFDTQARLQELFLQPNAVVPYQGNYPGTLNFNGTTAPASGRRNNRGYEGLSLTPDGKRLVAFLQSPTIQDGGAGNLGRNTRITQFDVDPASPNYGKVVVENVYQLTLNGNATTNRHTPVSEVISLNPTTFLVLERDGIGLGADPGLSPTYKRVVLASTEGASNLAGSGYDLAKGAPGQLSLPTTGTSLPSGISAVQRQDFVDLLDAGQLAKFGLNTSTNQDQNSLSEKWEGMAIIPLRDPAQPDDYLLLLGNDNDFKSEVVYHNGVPVGTNTVTVDIMILAYRVTLPGVGSPRKPNVAPTVRFTLPTGGTWAKGALPLTADVADPDGLVVKAEFFEDGVKLGEKAGYPWVWNIESPAVGDRTYRVVVTDDAGAKAEASATVTVTASNLAPAIAISSPTDATTAAAPYSLALKVATTDVDGFVAKVDYFDGATKLGSSGATPFALTVANLSIGVHSLTAVATDNLGLTTTSTPVVVTVTRNVAAPMTLQFLHASDFEAGTPALDDAPRFSSVLNGLRADHAGDTLVLSSGDNYIPGPFFTASADPAAPFKGVKGRGDIAILNALGIQAACFGNHEFDDNTPQIRSLILPDASANYAGTLFPYLSANLDFGPDSSLASLVTADGQEASAVRNKIAKSTVITVAGQKIGIVGATTKDLRTISSPGSVGVSADLVGTVQSAVDKLLAQGVNKVVLLAHLQDYRNEFDLAVKLRDVDIIIGGGSHEIFAKPGDRVRPEDSVASAYPTVFRSTTGEPVYVVNTGANYRYVGRLIAGFDAAGVLTAFDPRSGSYPTDAQGVVDTGNQPPNAAVVSTINTLAGIIDTKDGNRFGRTTVYLNGLRSSIRTEETNLGDLTADANLWRARQTDPTTLISLKNGGGIRDSIGGYSSEGGQATPVPPPANPRVGKKEGEVSQLDIENSLRFNNGLTLITLTAQQLRDTFEWAVAASGTPGQYPQVSGVIFSYMATNKPMTYVRNSSSTPVQIDFPGERLRNLVVVHPDDRQDLVVENGVLVGDPDRKFRVVTLNFLASGGDSYLPLSQGTDRVDLVAAGATVQFETDGGEQQALAQYLKAIGLYTQEDVSAAQDVRIQNLSRRPDGVLEPVVRQIAAPAPSTRLTFRTLPGRRYAAESIETIGGTWERLPLEADGTGELVELLDSRAPSDQRYYRIVVVQ